MNNSTDMNRNQQTSAGMTTPRIKIMTGMQSLLWIRPELAYQKESMNRTDLIHSDKSTRSNLSVEEGQYMRGNPIEVCATP